MFCPQCGQQSSEEVRFCHRCGLPLSPHAAILAGGGTAAAAAGAAHAPERSAKSLGTRRGAKMMFFSVVLFPVFFGFCFIVDTPAPLFVPLTLFLAGLAWLVYSRLFGEELVRVYGPESRRAFKADSATTALGAQQFVPAPLFGRQRTDTSEIAPPPSVTESTTSLLERDV